MTRREVDALRSGDEVFWNDPDEGTCSRVLRIGTIEVVGAADEDIKEKNPVVVIMEVDGSVVECFASELS